jgi:hypothetical protein
MFSKQNLAAFGVTIVALVVIDKVVQKASNGKYAL